MKKALLFSQRYIIEKGSKLSEIIIIQNGITPGILFNKFIFTDGSVISFETIK
jgi:hypothetical protein